MPDQPDQPQQPQDNSVKFGRFDGFKNTIDRERLGPRDLAVALDIDLDDDGQVHRRRGRTQVANGSYHSLWNADDGTVYGALNGTLGKINPDYSFVSLGLSVGPGASAGSWNVASVQVGNEIYISFPDGSGIINHTQFSVGPWGPSQDIWLSPVVNPTATLPAIAGKLLGSPPVARYLAYYNGRIYCATRRVIWATELFLYQYVDKTRTYFYFEDDITMVAAVSDGLYVGTTGGCYFLGGERLQEMRRRKVMDSPVIPGSLVTIPGELANPPQVGPGVDTPLNVSVSFMTTRGYCVGEDSGHCTNLTEGKVFFPVAARASAFFRRQDGMNQYIVCADSEGDPVNGARFGDFVDAEIIRGKVAWTNVDDNLVGSEQTQ